MLEAGDELVAEKLTELPADHVTLAFHKHMLVVDLATLMTEIEDGENGRATEKALESCLTEEVDDYHLVSRRPEGWDDVLAAVLALDRDHHDCLRGILERCCAMSAEYIEDNGGLYDVLTSEEMLEGDVAADREDRRAEAGHVAPSSAAAFLKLARTTEGAPLERDPLTRAYFRGLAKHAPVHHLAPARPEPARRDLPRLLSEAGIVEPAARPLLAAGPARDEPAMSRAMRRLAQEDPACFDARSEEIAYLANVLAAGHSIEGRRLRPGEAVRLAITTCSLGLELAVAGARTGGVDPDSALVQALRARPADVLFRVAWAHLHHA